MTDEMRRPHFRASVRARTPDEGGRSIPILIVGYRPDLAFENERYWWGAALSPDEEERGSQPKVELGQSREVDFSLRSPSEILPRLHIGSTFKMMEGQNAVADGVITLIYDPEGRSH